MQRYISRDKLSKKARKELVNRDRLTWNGLNPTTRIKESKKIYNRKKARNEYDEYQSKPFLFTFPVSAQHKKLITHIKPNGMLG